MPIYEYLCPECGNDFETIHKVSAPAPACPKCGAGVKKKISLAAFHLKGGGWYNDAYAGKDNKGPKSGDSSGAAATAAPTKAESTSTPAAAASDSAPAKAAPSKPASAKPSAD